ncbi:DUF2269 domain-containing protein [Lampropedia puyangensis]|uniref:DUF2269 domain-containing protein n=1 Tax=Lampropedia puyangensis TaxID=1330072 RepID=A0A4S8F5T7_9BURK|nr:DUF2269 domain-containing protein [Lampropedia puyangensis]THU02798.1 DUF2269 domain-containing protein [Lampropedia puyangensis]
MNSYLVLKYVHILSSVLLVGTGFGSAFYLFFANRTRDVSAIAAVSRLVVRADWWFTTPTVVLQPLTGIALVHWAGWGWDAAWLQLTLGLYALSGACWLPVVWLQIRMARIALQAHQQGENTLPRRYWQYARVWEWLGYPAFIAMLVIYWLMVQKPPLWN